MEAFTERRNLVIQEIKCLMHSGSISNSVFCSSFLKPKKIFEGALAIKAFYEDYNH